MTDLDIARDAALRPIEEIAEKAGFAQDTVSPYGRYIAKINARRYAELPTKAKLVLVTAINPTPAGEGKTTTSVALSDGLARIGKNVMLALREPSLGPVFGMKGEGRRAAAMRRWCRWKASTCTLRAICTRSPPPITCCAR